jgi:Spy/CpxP family protein refolding chaperone
MNQRAVIVLALALIWPAASAAQQPPPQQQDPAFAQQLFAPELVMQHQAHLALSREQRDAITGAIKELQNAVVDLQWRMQEETQRLNEMLEGPSVDGAAALAQVDRVLEVERQVKKAHLLLLIKIKNTLNAEQQARLRELRYPTHPEPRTDGGPPRM